jgi:Ala-tRNA(Pro) deacylase
MPIAKTVQSYLDEHQTPFDMVAHRHSASSLNSASEAHVLPSRVAKAVLLEDERERNHFLMAVIPATHRVEIARLSRHIGRPVHLATEKDAAGVFPDCEPGAIPAIGPAYGLETVLDDSLMEQQDLYFEAGDHEHLVHVKAKALFRLMSECGRGRFSQPL